MTRGRRGNQTYTGFNGASDASLRGLNLSNRSNANRQDRRVPPSQEAMRQAIAAGMCPFCGDQFKNIAGHTNRTHGVSAIELKEIVGIPKSYPACSPELSKTFRERSDREDRAERMSKMRGARKGQKRNLSEAGKKVNRDKLAKWRESTGDDGQAQRIAAMRESKRRISERNAPKYEEAFALLSEGYMLKDVAAHVGLHYQTLSKKWRERYPDVDLRSSRHQAKRLHIR